jgi:hypothetical protein
VSASCIPKVLIKTSPFKKQSKKENTPIEKWTKDMNKQFTKEYNWQINI